MNKKSRELHEHFMGKCISLAEIALKSGDPPVGSILVWNYSIIGRGIESSKSTLDITNHAEILAIKDAIKKGNSPILKETVLYSTHEPCMMCSYVLRHYKIPQIVFGAAVDFVGGFSSRMNVLTTKAVPKWENKPTIVHGVCIRECLELNKKFEESIF
ncbi:MAG TPA: nucleoside deaminase [Puia sp.]|nr:nucleoside deaminase [Puia sp.]